MANLLQTIKRTYFWVLCPLVMILAGVFWILGVSGLQKEKAKSLDEINNLYKSVDAVKSKPEYANTKVQEGMEKLIAKRRSEVAEAWTRKYEQQTSEKIGILKWPDISEFPESDRADAAKLLAIVKDLRPIEKKVGVKLTPQQDLVLTQRQIYAEYIARKLPELAQSIGAQWMVGVDPNAAMAGGSMMAGPPGGREGEFSRGGGIESGLPPAPEEALVFWNPANQQEIVQTHFTWGLASQSMGGYGPGPGSGMGRMENRAGPPGGSFTAPTGPSGPQPPQLNEILYAQEDLWVLKALLEVIARANKGATGRFNAAVKEIEFIRFGAAAMQNSGMIDTPMAAMDPNAVAEGAGMEGTGPTAGPPAGPPGAGPPDSYQTGRRAEFGSGGGMEGGEGGAVVMTVDIARDRYVDSSYQPLDPSVLRKVMTTPAEALPEEHYLAVAKRIPVRMRAKIDQRKLYNFLLECANSELTLEVRQLRVNPNDSLAMSGGMSGMPGMPGGMSSGMPGPMSMGGGEFSRRNEMAGPPSSYGMGSGPGPGYGFSDGMGGGMTGMTSAVDEHSRTDVTVEIYGIIYIYNPVDKVILKEPEATDTAPAAEDAVARR